ncbi:MAG TPA: lysophospholipid acyltransferase family protein [Pyrinomonadaceae bacterium]
MSETSTDLTRRGRQNGAQAECFVLPQWVIDLVKPVGHGISRVLWRVSFRGLENIPESGGLIVAANHQTYIDPFWMGFAIKRPLRFLAWNEAFGWPVIGKLMGMFGAWPLELDKSDLSAIKRSLQWLREGGVIVIFPEGGRGNPDGSPDKFKPGAVRMALEAGVPILPVTIRGGHKVWPKGHSIPRFHRVEIIYHKPITVEQQNGEDVRQCARRETQRLSEIIRSAL